MSLATRCPGCEASLRIDHSAVGRRVRCPKCRQSFEVSSVSFEKSDAPSAVETLSPASTGNFTASNSSEASSDHLSETADGSRKTVFGRFQLNSVLGQGTYGKVYRARDPVLDRDIALKVPKFTGDRKRMVERFLREAKSAAQLRHPNIVGVFESGQVDDEYFIASEIVDGQTLEARIAEGAVEIEQAVRWCRDLAEGLAYAHECGVVHRDIKPGNILLDRSDRPRITDFGLAKRMNDDATMTSEGSLLGTPAYMSPEQARGETDKIGPASDQYSLGVVLYELLTGKRPFEGAPHVVIAKAGSQDPPPSPRSIRPEIPRDLEAICLRSLEKLPNQRYRGCQRLADDLQRWLEGSIVLARPIGNAERLMRWCRRNPALSASMAVTIGLIMAIVGGAFTRVVIQLERVEVQLEQAKKEVAESRKLVAEAQLAAAAPPEPPWKVPVDPIPVFHGNGLKNDQPIQPINVTGERRTAERLLQLKKGKVELGNKDRLPWIPLKDAVPAEPFCILNVDLQNTDLFDDQMDALDGCRNLEKLNLSGNKRLKMGALTSLGLQPNLRELDISGTAIQDVNFDWLANFPALTHLNVHQTPFSSTAWQSLPSMPGLVSLHTSPKFDDQGFQHVVENCPNLGRLSILDSKIRDLSPVARLTRLTALRVGSLGLSDAGIGSLMALRYLSQLSIDSPNLEDFGNLSKLAERLTHFAFRESADVKKFTTSERWKFVTEMTGLLDLEIGGLVCVDPAALQQIAKLPNLRRLIIEDDVPGDRKSQFRSFKPDDITEFRRQRPDVELKIGSQSYSALEDWPGKSEGHKTVLDWAVQAPGSPALADGSFAADAAKKLQKEWSKHLNQPAEVTNSAGMKFLLIPPGELHVDVGLPSEPRTALKRVSSPYYLAECEVTVGQFKQFVTATGYVTEAERFKHGRNRLFQPEPALNWKNPGYAVNDDLPVNYVSPADAWEYCKWLDQSESLDSLVKYRVPTDLEWRLACRAGGAGNYGFAGTGQRVFDYAWTAENVNGFPTPVQKVKTKRENPFGLYDVLGNVWEWYVDDSGTVRGVLGGSINDGSGIISPDYRVVGTDHVQWNVGFRVLREIRSSSKFGEQPVLVSRDQPLGIQATVSRPTPIPTVRSWTIELANHQGHGSCVAWSPSGDVIATHSWDMSIRLWDRNGQLKSVLLGESGGNSNDSICFSQDGLRLASVDMSTDAWHSSRLRIWNVATGACEVAMPLPGWGHTIAWSPDGKNIAYSGTMGSCDLFDITTRQVTSLNVGGFGRLSWSPDSRSLCVLQNRMLTLFDVSNRQKRAELKVPFELTENTFHPMSVAWSPDGHRIAAAFDQMVVIWDAVTFKHLRTIKAGYVRVSSLAWDHRSQLLMIVGEGGDGATRSLLDSAKGEFVESGPSNWPAYGVAWSPDDTEIVVFVNGALQFIDAKTGTVLRSGPGRGTGYSQGSSCVISNDGQFLTTKRIDSNERMKFDFESGQLVGTSTTPNGHLVATDPHERWHAYLGWGQEKELTILPDKLDQSTITLTIPAETFQWRSDPGGERIAMAVDKQVLIYDTLTGRPEGALEHFAKLWAFEWSPVKQQLVTVTDDKVIHLWDTATKSIIREFRNFPLELSRSQYRRDTAMIGFAPDGLGVWVPFGGHAGLLDLQSSRVGPIENFSNGNAVESLTLADDGARVLGRELYGWSILRDRDGSRHVLGQWLGTNPRWHPDSRRFLSGADGLGLRGYDAAGRKRLGTLWPIISGNHWICIGSTGHYRGSPQVEQQIVYVAQLDDGSHVTLSPSDFSARFGWQNDPDKATLLKLVDE